MLHYANEAINFRLSTNATLRLLLLLLSSVAMATDGATDTKEVDEQFNSLRKSSKITGPAFDLFAAVRLEGGGVIRPISIRNADP